MARPATGQVVVRDGKRGRAYALRFRAYGRREYVTLGTAEEGWTLGRAEEELANVLADVRRGIWRAPEPAPAVEVKAEPTFHQFASEWLATREAEGLADRTIEDYRWALTHHLLPWFKDHQLTQITALEIDRYKVAKAAEGSSARIRSTRRSPGSRRSSAPPPSTALFRRTPPRESAVD